ncbi:hypothetical protein ACOSP7_003361 [Xanthoceras sorbifolium]
MELSVLRGNQYRPAREELHRPVFHSRRRRGAATGDQLDIPARSGGEKINLREKVKRREEEDRPVRDSIRRQGAAARDRPCKCRRGRRERRSGRVPIG